MAPAQEIRKEEVAFVSQSHASLRVSLQSFHMGGVWHGARLPLLFFFFPIVIKDIM